MVGEERLSTDCQASSMMVNIGNNYAAIADITQQSKEIYRNV